MVPKVEAQVRLTLADHNGHKLLWQIGTVCIKVFGRLGPLPDPVWGLSDNVFTFAAMIKTHRQLRQFCAQPPLKDKFWIWRNYFCLQIKLICILYK
jgi:hypothetical protein